MPDHSRIEDLRRRVEKDPASIAFAQLAEEHRRAGQHQEAIDVASAGLSHHPAYLSARVTLGRALLELGRLDEAAAEFEYVVRSAPDNLTAVRQLADIHQRRRTSTNQARSHQPDGAAPAAPVAQTPLSPAGAVGVPRPAPHAPVAVAPPELPAPTAVPRPAPAAPTAVAPPEPAAPTAEEMVVAELEAWLAVIDAERRQRATSHAHAR